jgi:hypothetical protein
MRKLLVLTSLFLGLLLFFPSSLKAETTSPVLSMEELSIQVMPEYAHHPKDKEKEAPPLLIGLHGTFMNKSDQPQKGKIEIPLPLKAKGFRIGYIADYNRDQTNMYEIEYEIDQRKGTVSWTTSEEIPPGELYKFVIEYYTNEIKVDKKEHTLSYKFQSFADIGMLRILFLEPLKTDGFSLTPAAESHQENGYGMNMFMYQYQNVKPNETKEIELKYERSETKTTMDIMNEMGNKTVSQGPIEKNDPLPLGFIIGIIGGISAIGALAIVFFLQRRKRKENEENNEKLDLSGTDYEAKKKRLRGMLVEGSITQDEYDQLLEKLAK